MRNFRSQFTTQALNATCTVQLPGTYTTAQWGIGGVGESPTTATRRCLNIPPRQQISRETGLLVTVPQQLLIEDPAGQVTTACRVVFGGTTYQITAMQRSEDGVFAQVTLSKA